jgi:hypothetical protein
MQLTEIEFEDVEVGDTLLLSVQYIDMEDCVYIVKVTDVMNVSISGSYALLRSGMYFGMQLECGLFPCTIIQKILKIN